MSKIQSLEECVLELNGERKCAFCGTTLADGEVCTCNKYKLAVRNFGLIATAQGQVDHYKGIIADLLDRMPEPSYEVREAIVPVLPAPVEEESTGDGGEGGEGSETE